MGKVVSRKVGGIYIFCMKYRECNQIPAYFYTHSSRLFLKIVRSANVICTHTASGQARVGGCSCRSGREPAAGGEGATKARSQECGAHAPQTRAGRRTVGVTTSLSTHRSSPARGPQLLIVTL